MGHGVLEQLKVGLGCGDAKGLMIGESERVETERWMNLEADACLNELGLLQSILWCYGRGART